MGVSSSFPALGQTTTTSAADKKKDENADPCQGKPKEFFIYDCDQQSGVCFCKPEQLTFVAIHFPDHYSTPIDILMWLYDMAEYRDDMAYITKQKAKSATTNAKASKKK